jgi:hypothetical protein
MAINAEIDGVVIPKHVIYSMILSFGDHFVEYGIPLLYHSRPVNIEVWRDWLLSILDHFDISISLKIVPKAVIMEVGSPNIRILIPLNHGMPFLMKSVGL